MGRDRMYDAISDVGAGQGFYSMIDDNGFIIQGRGLPFMDSDVIPLGMQLLTPGNYQIGIGAIDGLFETDGQTIYLRDNESGYLHDLSDSPFSFNSDSGVIEGRFDIVFTTPRLSIESLETQAGLTLIELSDGSLQFKVSDDLTIDNVKIYDTLGRLLYNLEGENSTETYKLSNLSQATYLARVTLSNDLVITKKAIKRF